MLFCDAASYKNHIYTKMCKKGSLTTYISNGKKKNNNIYFQTI